MGYVNGTSILETEIINALKINSTIDWDDKDVNKEFLELIKFVRKLFRESKYLSIENLLKLNALVRPPYAYCAYNSALLAKKLSYNRISFIEFGVAKGNGLLYLENLADRIEKELNIVIEKISELDSTDIRANDALNLLSDFYDREEDKRRESEQDEIRELILLEFAGLFNGTEGRLKQALKNDETVQVALDVLSNSGTYQASLSSTENFEN